MLRKVEAELGLKVTGRNVGRKGGRSHVQKRVRKQGKEEKLNIEECSLRTWEASSCRRIGGEKHLPSYRVGLGQGGDAGTMSWSSPCIGSLCQLRKHPLPAPSWGKNALVFSTIQREIIL
jgi:hypothetical protein